MEHCSTRFIFTLIAQKKTIVRFNFINFFKFIFLIIIIVKKWEVSKGLKYLSLPKYKSSGIFMFAKIEHRFLIIERFSNNLQSVIDESSFKILDQVKVFNIMKQVVSALEYIHDRGYAHGDIKAANLMIKNSHQIYLIDFGLVVKFMNNGKHCEYEARAERKHKGTIDYKP